MIDKYKMSLEDNIFLAKRSIVDIIWKSARLVGLNITFPDTEAIYNGSVVSNLKVDTIIAINNLKYAWHFIFDSIEFPIDYQYICKLNQLVGSNLINNAGFIRNFPISVGGTKWKSELPIESQIKEEILEILNIQNPTERAITMMLSLMRMQMFGNGNKRTSMLVANQIMISNGAGVISIPIELQREFLCLLVRFYETNDMTAIKEFVYNTCIDGIPATKTNDKVYNPNYDYYLKVSYEEAQKLKEHKIYFEGTIKPDKLSVIRINIKDKTAVDILLNSMRNKKHE